MAQPVQPSSTSAEQSIPGKTMAGKDPPLGPTHNGGIDKGIGEVEDISPGGDGDQTGQRTGGTQRPNYIEMPPGPISQTQGNPRRRPQAQTGGSTGEGVGNTDGVEDTRTPLSPGIILTQPTFTEDTLPSNLPIHTLHNSHSSGRVPFNPSAINTGTGNSSRSLLGPGISTEEASTRGIDTSLESATAPRPYFAPLFTLVGDTETGKLFHPKQVHYLFADDEESGALTDALVRCCNTGGGVMGSRDTAIEDGKVGKGKEKEKGKMGEEREERVIILDLNNNGDGVTAAWSANPSWAVLNAEVTNAPAWEGGDADAEDGEGGKGAQGGMMLRIEGVGAAGGEMEKKESSAGESGVAEEEMQTLLEGFDRKMEVLRRVMKGAEGMGGAGAGAGAGGGGVVRKGSSDGVGVVRKGSAEGVGDV